MSLKLPNDFHATRESAKGRCLACFLCKELPCLDIACIPWAEDKHAGIGQRPWRLRIAKGAMPWLLLTLSIMVGLISNIAQYLQNIRTLEKVQGK